MIAALRGCLLERGVDRVVVDVGGVGYLVRLSLQSLADLPAQGQEVRLLVHTHVREDALELYGFLEETERRAFEILKTVSGVGPKLALTILSGMPVEQLIGAITGGDHRQLQKIPGVGKRTAERLVVELKDRFGKLAPGPQARPAAGTETETLIEALTGLGYKRGPAERAVAVALEASAGGVLSPEHLLREALARLQEAS